jgi:hypothetical protein
MLNFFMMSCFLLIVFQLALTSVQPKTFGYLLFIKSRSMHIIQGVYCQLTLNAQSYKVKIFDRYSGTKEHSIPD